MKEKMRFLATSLKRERERREQSFQGYSEKLCEILKTKKAYRLLNTYSKRQSQIWWYRTDKHRKKKRKQRTTSSSRKLQRKQIPMRQRNTGEAQHTASRRKFCESGKNMKSLCVQICDVEDDLSRNLVLSFRHERSGEEESLARENNTLRQTSHEDDRLLSLSPSLCFSFTLSFHLSKAHVPDVSTSRVFAAEIHSEVGKEATAKSVFWAVSKGGIISFLHGRLRFGRHYMIVRFDEEITRNSHVSGWGGSRKSKHLGRGRWKISGGIDRTVYN